MESLKTRCRDVQKVAVTTENESLSSVVELLLSLKKDLDITIESLKILQKETDDSDVKGSPDGDANIQEQSTRVESLTEKLVMTQVISPPTQGIVKL